MQTKTLLFKRLFIGCSRIHEQGSSYRKCIVQCSLEYTIRGVVVVVVYTSLDVTYGSSLILIKCCRVSVTAL